MYVAWWAFIGCILEQDYQEQGFSFYELHVDDMSRRRKKCHKVFGLIRDNRDNRDYEYIVLLNSQNLTVH